MADPKKLQIQIQSILGGHSQYRNFSGEDEYSDSFSIDPDLDTNLDLGPSSGYIRPAPYSSFGTTTGAPFWIVTNPKNELRYVFDAVGSVYTYNSSYTLSGLADLNDGGTASGQGAEYYDNYIYGARDTTIARYGPLNGTPAWTDDYWVATLSKTALINTTYPSATDGMFRNRPMLRHSDGKLYFPDVVGNQGVLHYIKTTKTTVEGDTDAGSTYNAIDFPYGMWPTALASYGTDIAVALYEGTSTVTKKKRAKLAFWDTVNPNTYDKITEVEFPDEYISALLNTNGVLYTFSGGESSGGLRICRFVGGYSFEQIAFIPNVRLPQAGAVDGLLNKISIGTYSDGAPNGGCVFSVGSVNSPVSNNFYCSMGSLSGSDAGVTVLKYTSLTTPETGTGDFMMERQGLTFNPAKWISRTFRIGQPFKITKIRIPLATVPNSTILTVGVSVDENNTSNPDYIIDTISSSNYPNKRNVTLRPTSCTGQHSFNLRLTWSGTSLMTVALPITIEYEVIDD